MSTSPRSASSRLSRLLVHTCFGLTLGGLTLLTVGCGGRAQSDAAMAAPAADASPETVARYLDGNWTLTLNEGAPNELTLPLQLDAGSVNNGTASVDGSIGGSAMSDGTLSFPGGAPSLRFTAQAMTVEGVAGPIDVPGPTNWTGTLQQGRLSGTVEGAGGAPTQWTARKGN